MSNCNDNKNIDLAMNYAIPKILLSMEKSPIEDDDIGNVGIRPVISALVKGNQNVIGIIVKRQVQAMITVDNTIQYIINLNLIIITNADSIVIIKQHKNLLTELIMIGKEWKNVVPSLDIKQLLIIPLGYDLYYRKKDTIISSGNSLKTETRKMHQLKS